jgi:hypothetical protein
MNSIEWVPGTFREPSLPAGWGTVTPTKERKRAAMVMRHEIIRVRAQPGAVPGRGL